MPHAVRLSALVLALAVALPVAASPLPEDWKKILDKAEQAILYSLDLGEEKEKPKETFHGSKVLGKTTLKGAEMKKLLTAFVKAVEEGKRGSRCFIPRHGLRVEAGKDSLDFVLCFECLWVRTHIGGKPQPLVAIGDRSEPFNAVLKEAKVPLPKGPKAD